MHFVVVVVVVEMFHFLLENLIGLSLFVQIILFFCDCILLFNHRNSQDDGGDFFGMLPHGILCTSHFTTQSAEILCADNDTIFISIRTEC